MLHIDFETRSDLEIKGIQSVGLWNYFHGEKTSITLLGWAYEQEPVEVWQPHLGPMPDKLLNLLNDPEIEIAAFNSTFERYALRFKLDIDIPIHRFQDPQASARYLSLPGSLDDVGEILGLPPEMAKDKEGKRLLDLFSKPHKKRKKKGEEITWEFYDWDSHPEDWAKFVEYCRRDVVAEREVMRREKLLGVWPLPPMERKIWELDQLVNDRGLPVCREFVTKAYELANREKLETIEINNKKTGLENSNSGTQLLAWAKTQGYSGTDPNDDKKFSLEKDVVKSQLKNNKELMPLCREVLENRQAAASTSYKKMSAILRQICSDDRIRNQFIYMGSSRCGRWSGSGYQFHNQARPTEIFENEENIDKARALIYAMDYEGIKRLFGSVLLTVKSNIRTAFVTKKGKRFNVSDLNAIETRKGAWVAGCQSLLHGFWHIPDFDPYCDFAMKMTQIPYETLVRDKKSKDPVLKAKAKHYRQVAKPGVLAGIYRMGPPRLQAYAESMGVIMSLDEAKELVRIFRESYPEICSTKEPYGIWIKLENAVLDVLAEGKVRVKRELGPNGCIKIDKFVFKCDNKPRTILRIQLPSGRFIHYLDARIEDTLMPWTKKEVDIDGNEVEIPVYKPALWYACQDQETKRWGETTSHGGKIFENIVQGSARDVLAEKLLAFEAAGLPVVGHVHDEGITETEDDPFAAGLAEMDLIMSEPISWAEGLPLGSDGFQGNYYHK